MKVLLILVDGMRSDSLAEIPEAQEMITQSCHTLEAQTVFPSVTLPCHMSLFHSVDPDRHGTTTNVYAPQVRPINGLCEVLKANNKKSAFFYSWEELRDISRPKSLAYVKFIAGSPESYPTVGDRLTDDAINYIQEEQPDFSFLYFGWPDSAGHRFGWMTPEYMTAIQGSWRNIKRIVETLSDEYAVIITADHGGHNRCHGTDQATDMTIPVFFKGAPFKANTQLDQVSIKDLAPTIAGLLGVTPDEEWEGKNLL